jgi:5-methylcytosine-specific restriction endonuclease McrA
MRDRWLEERGITYETYRRDPGYRARRWPVFDNARGVCQDCKRWGNGLDVHHLHYETLGAETAHDDLIALCRDCHHVAHGRPREDSSDKPVLGDARHHRKPWENENPWLAAILRGQRKS